MLLQNRNKQTFVAGFSVRLQPDSGGTGAPKTLLGRGQQAQVRATPVSMATPDVARH